jgi:UDP-N-acetylmuramoyl-L-alanyl-D-glutamate--2,6-diaminopimelate ligase
LELKVTAETIAAAIGNFTGVPGRMEQVPNKSGLKLIVDFAHTPNALEKALTTLQPEAPHKLIAVFGCAGLRDRGKRPMMGDIGSRLADEVIFTAEDPRTENLWNIIDQMTAGVKENRGHVHKIPDRQQAINFAVKLAKPGDTVVVCGKGHEQSMCFGKIELPWSDKAALITAIKENGKQ